ncbi:hypothetical protein WJX73_005798 [Symbiochloris irregularis]|uniref:Cold shock domain-containing protein E1 n=1 Tax=Symbiochloris irregularis TaxID=706552 RepID=A0AAW1PJT3_9CHLO
MATSSGASDTPQGNDTKAARNAVPQPGRGRGRARGNKSQRASAEESAVAAASLASSAPADGLAFGLDTAGLVATVKDSFGFLRLPNHTDGIFFHASSVLIPSEDQSELISLTEKLGRVDLTQYIQVGQQVQFTLAPGTRGARFTATQVRATTKKEAPGTIKQLPDFKPKGERDWRARQAPLGGLITWQPPAAEGESEPGPSQDIGFGASDILKGPRLQLGDCVHFVIVERWEDKRASQVQLVMGSRESATPAADETFESAQRLKGFVYSWNPNSGRGSIRREDGLGQVSFSLSSVAEESRSLLNASSEVEFSLNSTPGSRKTTVVNVVCLAAGSIPDKARLTGRVSGRVVRVPAMLQGQARERPGAIRCDDADLGSVVSFSSAEAERCLGEGESLREGDDVEFEREVMRRSGGVYAVGLMLKCRGSERRELGKVALLKGKFGFINCCERRSNLFFHFGALLPPLRGADLSVGNDLEFTVGLEPVSEERPEPRTVALRVSRAAPGSAVFETLSEEVLVGTVIERLQSNGFTTVSSGVLELEEASGQRTRLTYGADDLAPRAEGEAAYQPLPGDRVTFRIATRLKAEKDGQAVGGTAARHAGRRATEVAAQRFKGTCFNWKVSFGFASVQDPRPADTPARLYFNANDLQGPQPSAGQPLSGIVAINSKGEPVARAIKVVPPPPVHLQEAVEAEAEAVPVATPPQRPKLMLLANNGEGTRKLPQMRKPLGPDGTKGFAPGRGRGIPPPPPAAPPAASAPGSTGALKMSLSGRLLNPAAVEPQISAAQPLLKRPP